MRRGARAAAGRAAAGLPGGLRVAGRGLSRESLERSLAGEGKLRIEDGKVSASRLFGGLAGVLGADLGDVLFSQAGSDFTIGGGSIRCPDVFLEAGSGPIRSLGLQGSTGLDGPLDYGVRLVAVEGAIGDRRIREVLDAVRKALGEEVVPLKLEGTLSRPQLALSLEAPGLDLRGILEKAAGIGLPGAAPRPARPAVDGKNEGGPDRPSLEDLLDAIRGKR